MYFRRFCLFVLLLVSQLVFGDDYQVTLTVSQVAIDASVNIALEGTFGSTTSQSLADNTLFNTIGAKGPFTITSTKPVGDILKFSLLRTDSLTTVTVHISQISFQRKTDIRLYTLPISLAVGPGSNEYIIPNPDVTSTSLQDVDTGLQLDKTKIELRSGDNKTIEAGVTTSNPQSTVLYRWYSQRNQQVPAILVSNVSRLAIVNAQQVDSSRYFCVVTVGQSIVKLQTIEIQVNFLTMSAFEVTLSEYPFVVEGRNVEVKCAASTNQANLKYQWSKNGEQVSSNEILKFEKIFRNNTGNYTCLVTTDNDFETSDVIHVAVNYLDVPKINNFNSTKAAVHIKQNEQLTLSCESEGYPNDLKYTFLYNGVKMTTADNAKTKLVLNIPSSGLYTCQVSNLYFSHESSVFVNVTRDTSTLPGTDDDDDEFWTDDKIIIFAMAGGFLVIILLMLLCICKLFRSGKTKDKQSLSYNSSPHFIETGTTESHGIYYQSYAHDNPVKNYREEAQEEVENYKKSGKMESVSSEDHQSNQNDLQTAKDVKKKTPKNSSNVSDIVNGKTQLNGMTVEYC